MRLSLCAHLGHFSDSPCCYVLPTSFYLGHSICQYNGCTVKPAITTHSAVQLMMQEITVMLMSPPHNGLVCIPTEIHMHTHTPHTHTHMYTQTVFDTLDRKIFLDARERSNPFEIIKGVIFQNRLMLVYVQYSTVGFHTARAVCVYCTLALDFHTAWALCVYCTLALDFHTARAVCVYCTLALDIICSLPVVCAMYTA